MMVEATPQRELIVGIDLGTTNSLIAICDERGPRIISDAQGRPLMPSVVRLINGEPIVGHEAREHAVEFPQLTVYSVKRLMGRGFVDVQDDLLHLSYEVVSGEHDTARVKIDSRIYTPQEISAIILKALKTQAETALKQEVRKAVVTVPAYFDDAQRQATRDAGRLAGLDVVRIVNEPTAAALAYGIGQINPQAEIIAVYDLGGGTFDISILQVTPPPPESPGSESFYQVLSTAGDTHLGGDDVDRMIVELVLKELVDSGTGLRPVRTGGTPVPPDQLSASARQALRNFAEAAKIKLSTEDTANLQIDLGNGQVFERTLTRDEFNRMIQPWVDRTIKASHRALRDAKLSPTQINRVILVGGSTRIPLVRQAVANLFQSQPYTALDPDQVVALGAAVQASILAGLNRDMLLLDVIPLSLGIETVGGAVAKLIVRNSTVPARATEMFSTSVDNQTNVKIHVLQGERELVKDCRSLGRFELRGIPPMPAGIPQIEVEFLIDANGILNVTAGERRSGKRASIQIVPRYGLTREEVDRMEAESFAHARTDMHAHRIIDLAVNAALDIKWIRDAMARVGDDVGGEYRQQLEQHIERLQQFIDQSKADSVGNVGGVDADAFHRAKEELDRASVALHELAITRSLRADEQ